MRKYFGAIAALLLLMAPAHAADVKRLPLAIAWDMDGEAADDDQIVAGPDDFVDSTSYTIDAQPDTCRVVNITVTDADSSITAGVLTVTGLDCWGDAQTCTFTFAAGGSGVKALTYGTGSSTTCAFSSVTDVSTGVLTGEGGAADEFEAGYTANSAYTYPIYGIQRTLDGKRYVDAFRAEDGLDTITVSGTAIASYHTKDGGAFDNLVAGDLVYITFEGRTYERKLTTVTDDDNAVISSAIPSDVAPDTDEEVKFRYKKFFTLVEDNDAWVPVDRRESAFYSFDVDANANTGGVTSTIQCGIYENGEYNNIVEVDTDNVATGATGNPTTSIDLRLAPFTHCRAGFKFGTGDDTDTAVEDINVFALIRR